MNNTHDDNATTWRDLADALSPQQVAYLDPRHGACSEPDEWEADVKPASTRPQTSQNGRCGAPGSLTSQAISILEGLDLFRYGHWQADWSSPLVVCPTSSTSFSSTE